MNISYFCMNPNNSLHNASYAPSLHVHATVKSLQALGHEVSSFSYGDERRAAKESLQRATKGLGRRRNLLRKVKPLLRDIYELHQNQFHDRQLVEQLLQDRPIDLIYERLFPSKSAVSLYAQNHRVPIIVESNSPARERKQYWGSPLQPLIDRIEIGILQRASALTVVSTPLKRHYEALGIAPEKIFVLPNGVDEERFSPDRISRDVRAALGLDGTPVLGFVGNIHPYHGGELFLPLARALQQAGKRVRFLIVGGGPGRKTLQEALNKEQLDENFTLIDSIPNSEVPDYIAAMDICLLPHFMWYGSPLKIFEYAAMAKAVVAPDLENIREALQHGKTAFLFKPGNPAALTTAVEVLLDRPQFRTDLGEAARHHILANHTWAKNAKRIVAIYEQVTAHESQQYHPGTLQADGSA